MDLLIKYQLTNYVIIVFTINAQLISKLPNQKAISIMCNVYNDTMMKWKINEKLLQKKKKTHYRGTPYPTRQFTIGKELTSLV